MKQELPEFDTALAALSQRREHLLCTSLFNPGAPDLPLGDKYRRGLATWMERFEAEPGLAEELHLVIFTDDSIGDLRVPERNATVVPFRFPIARRKDRPGHMRMFGTLVRFYPMFTPPPAGVQLVDIDLRHEPGRNEFGLHGMLGRLARQWSDEVDILYVSWRLHQAFPHRVRSFKQAMGLHGHVRGFMLPYALSNLFCCTRPLPQHLLTDFVDASVRGAISDRWGYQWAMPEDSPPHEGIFSFGTDELFLNAYAIPALLKANFRFATLDWISPFEPFVAIHREITRLDRWRVYGFNPEELQKMSWAVTEPAEIDEWARMAWDILHRMHSESMGLAEEELLDGWLPRYLLDNLMQFTGALEGAHRGMVLTRYDSQGEVIERRYLPGITMNGVGRLRWV